MRKKNCTLCTQGLIRYRVSRGRGAPISICETCFLSHTFLYHGKCVTCHKVVRNNDSGCLCYDDIPSSEDDFVGNSPTNSPIDMELTPYSLHRNKVLNTDDDYDDVDVEHDDNDDIDNDKCFRNRLNNTTRSSSKSRFISTRR